MKKYFIPTIEIVKLNARDIIATSVDFDTTVDTDYMDARGMDEDWSFGTGDWQ